MTAPAIRNFEIKCRAPQGLARLRESLSRLGASYQWTRRQVDTFFATPRGRLKLREEYEGDRLLEAQLIPYLRADRPEVRESRFVVLPVGRPEVLGGLLSDMLGRRLVVVKSRELWLHHGGTVRIHLDAVEGLGAFCELEAVVETEDGVADGSADSNAFAALQQQRAQALLRALGLGAGDVVCRAYADLLAEGQ